MTVKERVLKRVEELDEARLLELERALRAKDKPAPTLEEELRLWDELARTLEGASPEDRAAFEEATRRRPLFGGRQAELYGSP
jgi:hypothetical protein